jgi:uncharacterized protein DUF5681
MANPAPKTAHLLNQRKPAQAVNPTNPAAWLPGQSGNPSGRPKSEHDAPALARKYTVRAVEVLGELLEDPDSKVRGFAANALLDRGHGKPTQTVEGSSGSVTILHLIAAKEVSEKIQRLIGEKETPPTLEGSAADSGADSKLEDVDTPVDINQPALE